MDTEMVTVAASQRGCLEDEILSLLHTCNRPSLRRVNVEIVQDAVRLQGVVSSFYLKQVAQAIAQSVDGVERVENNIEVRSAST